MTKQFGKEQFYHLNFAHRGLHDIKNGIPENSLAAFRAAAEAGYGAELDVRLSKDGEVVVFHDNDLKRVCGLEGRVEDFDLEKVRTIKLCGTEETIPLFSDVLSIFRDKGGPLIVEIKTGARNAELCRKTYEQLKKFPGVYCIESFSPVIVNWFRKNAPEVFRGQLAGTPESYKGSVPAPVGHILSSCIVTVFNKPDFIAYQICERPKRVLKMREKGVLLFAWTSRTPDTNEAKNDAVIFEHYRPPLKY